MGLHCGLAMHKKPAAETEMTRKHYDMLMLKKLTKNFRLVITIICSFFHVLNCLELIYILGIPLTNLCLSMHQL